ncbi:MAG: lipopolysaccharide biosynthesis protein [Devosia sp.]
MKALLLRLTPSLMVVANQGFNSLANFATTVWLIRWLGLESFGIFSIYWLVSLLVVGLVNALVSLPMVSLAGQHEPVQRRRLLTAAIALVGAAVVLLSLVALGALLTGFRPGVAGGDVAIIAVLAGAQLAAEFVRRLLFFVGRVGWVWRLDLARFAAIAGLFYLLFHAGQRAPEVHAASLAAANAAVTALVCVLLLPAVLRRWDFAGFGGNARRLVQSGAWLSMSNLVHFANDNLFLLVASGIIGPAATGLLRACQTVVGLVNPLLQSLEYMLPRRLGADIAELGRGEATRGYLRRSGLLLLGFAAVLVSIAVLAEPILLLVAGEAGRNHGWLLQVYCALTLLIAVVAIINILLRAQDRTLSIFLSPLLAAMFSIVAVVPLAQGLGLPGVAAGMLGAQLIITLLQVRAVWPTAAAASNRGGSVVAGQPR